jgi:hypothetical protein
LLYAAPKWNRVVELVLLRRIPKDVRGGEFEISNLGFGGEKLIRALFERCGYDYPST